MPDSGSARHSQGVRRLAASRYTLHGNTLRSPPKSSWKEPRMRSSTSIYARRFAALAVVGVLAVSLLSGCGTPSGSGGSQQSSENMTPGQFPETKPVAVQPPPPPQLKKPETAVFSYLLWISYAYRILDSNVATMAFSPMEEVRVNSYVELNRQKGQAIDQRLVAYKVTGVPKQTDTTATVTARETWVYRYIDIKTVKYKSPVNTVSYETTYTVVKTPKGWLVDSVDAKAVGSEPK
jgi:hypothetical protein